MKYTVELEASNRTVLTITIEAKDIDELHTKLNEMLKDDVAITEIMPVI